MAIFVLIKHCEYVDGYRIFWLLKGNILGAGWRKTQQRQLDITLGSIQCRSRLLEFIRLPYFDGRGDSQGVTDEFGSFCGRGVSWRAIVLNLAFDHQREGVRLGRSRAPMMHTGKVGSGQVFEP